MVALLLVLGCAYKVQIETDPIGAMVRLPNGQTVEAPAEVKLRWIPFNKQIVEVRAAGHRPLKVDLRRHEVRLGHYVTDSLFRPATWAGKPRGQVEIVLVPRHGPAGTWLPEDVGERGAGLPSRRDRRER